MEILGVQLTVWNCLMAWVVIVTTYVIYDWLHVLAWRQKYNLKGPFPLPIIGNFLLLLSKDPDAQEMDQIQKFGSVFATHVGAINGINIFDLELLKKIFIKEHIQFQNRYSIEGLDPKPIDVGLLNLKDNEWKRVRSIVTPTFSPGKIKLMTEEIIYCADCLVKSLTKPATTGETIETLNHFGCFSMDVIAGTAFGIRTHAYTNPDQPFVYHAKRVFGQEVTKNPLVILALFFPTLSTFLARKLGISFFYPLDSIKFFCDVIEKIMEDRKQTNQTDRADMIGLLMSAQENEEQDVQNTNKKLSKDELMAIGFLAFVAGYDTTASLLTFFSYAMAMNPEIQDQLVEEINSKFPSDDVKVKYDDLADLPYLDQVISETLRMYPPLARMNRTTSYSQDVLLDGHCFPRNTLIGYSIWHFHHNPRWYEDPDVFKPERFSPEEKQKRDPVTFMPFGHGPRNCIGMRLALLEAKIAAIHVLKKMKFVRCQDTEEPLELIKMEAFLRPKRPIKVGAKLHKDK